MASAFDNLCEIKSGREAWRIKVRVVRTWKVPSFMNPGPFVRRLFVNLLLGNSMSNPVKVWEQTWELLSDGILYSKRRLLNNSGELF